MKRKGSEMAMGASLQLVNKTGYKIQFTSITQVNDDATFNINPAVGSIIDNDQSCLISMANSSVPFVPKGVGANAVFSCSVEFGSGGTIYFDDPAVGEHSFQFSSIPAPGAFKYDVQNPDGNSYVVTITTDIHRA
jgi:hypothetical protein